MSYNAINTLINDGPLFPQKYLFHAGSLASGVWLYLPSVELGEGLRKLGQEAFDGCTSLTSIEIPEGVAKIRDHAFCDCMNLSTIIIPASVTYLLDSSFLFCDNLEIHAPKGSYAFKFAKQNKIKVKKIK